MEKKIETRTEIIYLGEEGIVYCIARKGTILEIDDAKENVQAIAKVIGNGKAPVFVDIRQSEGASKEARKYFTSNEVAEIQSAVAMLVDSGFSKLIGNFFIGLNKPIFPLKLFTSKDEAVYWLKNFIEKKSESHE